MKKLIIIYALLIGSFMVYVYYEHFKESPMSPWDVQELRGELNETYVMVTFLSGIDYWKSSLKGFEDAAQALNVSVEYRGATQYDVQEQITVLEQVIARKPSGIALSAMDPYALSDTINKAVDSGIPVVFFDSGALDSNAYSYIGTNNYNAGMTAARKMAELVNEEGSVAVITLPDQMNHQGRVEGFEETLHKEFPNIQLVAVEDGQGDRLISRNITQALMEEYPDLAGIFATEANGGVGIGDAVRLEQKAGDVHIISFDTDKGTLDMIEHGVISATLSQGTWSMGYWSLAFLFHLNHELTEPQVLHSRDLAPLPVNLDTGITVVTKENVKYFFAR